MGKSAFIMETPACCGECPMSGTSVCRKWSAKKARAFPEDCPLRKEPEKAGDPNGCSNRSGCGGMGQDADGKMKLDFAGGPKKHTNLDFGRISDRVYMDARQSVTLMGRGGSGAAKTGYYLLPVYTIIGNVLGRKAGAGGNQLGAGQDISPTLTANDRHAVAAPEESWRQKYRVRSLTPLECERLDGFPDGWTRYGASGKEMSDNARIKALGNSIAVPCAERVFIGILAAEQEM